MHYKSDLSKTSKELSSVKDRLSRRNYTGDEIKLTKYNTQIEKCKKDVESLKRQLQATQGANVLTRKKLESRKVDCDNILRDIKTIRVLLNGKTQLSQNLKKLENKIVYIGGKIKHYQVYKESYLFISRYKLLILGTVECQAL